ncbi:gluconokinase [Tianweitania sediminis]|nr:gluconokinase [Tianweitania sediminis]
MIEAEVVASVYTHFILMGVAGSGKTLIGERLAARLGFDFIDGDDLHSPSNIAKMARGEPLTDDDRAPWLKEVGLALRHHEKPLIIGCSALKRRYRDQIRAAAGRPLAILYLEGDRALIADRMAKRQRHFMPVTLIDSQFAALEPPGQDEAAIRVSIDNEPETIVRELANAIDAANTA